MDIKDDDFNLEKELAQSKINISINNIFDSNKYLKTREWDYLNDDKIFDIEAKVESISQKLDKKNSQKTIGLINSSSFDNYYANYKITENKYKISCLCSLNFLVESTYYFRENHDESKKFDLSQLEPYVYKYRNINGDGDCFYRGLIFSLLENIILTNNIMQMKELLILYYEKINKSNKLINEKEYLKKINELDIDIVSIIMYIIIIQMENDISKAYKVLLKAFLFFPEFDFSILFFTRYLFYEYISANEDKIFSKEYQLEIGCLLPDTYVADRGTTNEYFFENYYLSALMNPKTFAEKIVLYVAPYVFNINMKILVYDYQLQGGLSTVQEKEFFNENNSKTKIEINLLFKKSHYDVYYIKAFFEEHKKNLNIFINKKENEIYKKVGKKDENLKKVKQDLQIGKHIEKEIEKNNKKQDEKQNIFPSNENKIKKRVEKIEPIDKGYKYDLNKLNNNLIIDDNYPICLECKVSRANEDNIYGLCDECLSDNLKNALYSAFYGFLKDRKNLINSKKKLHDYLTKRKYQIVSGENIPILEAINNSKFKFEDLFISVRSQLCLYCFKTFNFEDEYFLELPCKCRLCTKECFLGYFNVIKEHIKLDKECNRTFVCYLNLLTCFCGFIYNTQNTLYMIEEMEKRNLKEQKIIYQEYILNIWNWKCFNCTNDFRITGQFFKVYFKCPDAYKKLLNSEKDFKHLLCDDCLQKYNIKNQKKIACNVCESEHEIIEFKKVNEKNEEESCKIF